MLTPGQAHDLACAEPLLENADPYACIGDKAYDAGPLIDKLTQRGITPVIPPRPIASGGLEIDDGAEHAALEPPARDLGEEALDEVEPGGDWSA